MKIERKSVLLKQKDVLGGYVAPQCRIYALHTDSSLLIGSPGGAGEDDDIKDLGDY